MNVFLMNLLLILILIALIYQCILQTHRLLAQRPRLAGVQNIPQFMLWEIWQTRTHIENLAKMGGLKF